MFRRGLEYLHREIDWAAIVGSALLLTFSLLFLVPLFRNYNYFGQTNSQQQANYWQVPWSWITSAAFWTAIFTGALTWYNTRLWRETKRLAEGAEIQSQQLERSIAAAELNAKNILRTTRPRIVWEDFKIVPFEGAVPPPEVLPEMRPGDYLKSIRGTVVNQGTARAFAKQGRMNSHIGDAIGPLVPSDDLKAEVFGSFEVGPDTREEFPLPIHSVILSEEWERGKGKLFLWGWIRYGDIHGIIRRAGFAYEYVRSAFVEDGGFFDPCGPAEYWYDVEEKP